MPSTFFERVVNVLRTGPLRTMLPEVQGNSANAVNETSSADTISVTKQVAREFTALPPAAPAGFELAHREAAVYWDILRTRSDTMLEILRGWLAHPEGRWRFLVVTDAIGAQNAYVLWTHFSPQDLAPLTPLLGRIPSRTDSYATLATLQRAVSAASAPK